MTLIRFIKEWTLPVAIAVGTSLYLLFAFVPQLADAASVLGPIVDAVFPLSVFATLLVTFAKVDFHLMHLCRWHGVVLLAQLVLIGLTVSLLLWPDMLGVTDADKLFRLRSVLLALLTCVIAPCASASPVVTSKLGGNLTSMTTFVLLSSLVGAVLLPAVFAWVNPQADVQFLTAFLTILRKMSVVLLLPLCLGAAIRIGARYRVRALEKIYGVIVRTPDLGFYCWAFSLAITSGVTVRGIVHSGASLRLLLAVAMGSFSISWLQWAIGRAIGNRLGAPIESGQAMFQKNTALTIFMASLYLPPIAAVGAGCYVLWQNIINSIELWRTPSSPNPRTPSSLPLRGEGEMGTAN